MERIFRMSVVLHRESVLEDMVHVDRQYKGWISRVLAARGGMQRSDRGVIHS